jgi:hypothetical protein
LVITWIWILVFNATFSYIMTTSFSGGGSRSTRREQPTMGKQLVIYITCGCESSALFFVITKLGANPRHIGDRLVWVVRSNDLTHWATRARYYLNTLSLYKHTLQLFLVPVCMKTSRILDRECSGHRVIVSTHIHVHTKAYFIWFFVLEMCRKWKKLP